MVKILIVTTSHDSLGATGHKTGVWFEELSTPYYLLKDGGADVVLASVRGGPVPFDPRSIALGDDTPPSVQRFLADAEAKAAADATPGLEGLDPAPFDALFLPGGHGTMWDLPDNPALARLVETLSATGRIVAAVCHGPAGLVSARRADGRPLVEGRRVAAFTNAEEAAVGLTDAVPFLLEDRLKALGARYQSVPAFQPFAVRDGALITGQNPMSSALVAQALLAALAERG